MDGERYLSESLTARELEIMRLVALGLSNRDIAEELVVAPETVRWYTKQIYRKLGISGRVQAINRAHELGLLEEGASGNGKTEILTPQQRLPNHSLPAATTPFIGRNREIAEVKRLLHTSRLLTLTGVGGTGKTRLALCVASDVLDDFADGVCFVDLAPLSDAALVAKAIATVLDVFENPGEPLPETLKRVLAGREMLLLIDNFEHVIEAAPLVSDLLAASPRLKALVTSREALRLSGEQEYPVPPLTLPSAEVVSMQDVTSSEAGSLFVQRAQMMQPRFALSADNAPAIGQICARLDGLPLAIELAAARCKLLTPQALLQRLDSRLTALAGGARDAPARQRTLRDTIEWSYKLLDEDEKTLFARLAVFRGGGSLAAIETICGHNLSVDVLDGLASLVDKSLVQQKETTEGEPRFVMLETLQEYASEKLVESGKGDALRESHAFYFIEFVEQMERDFHSPKQLQTLNRVRAEQENIRLAVQWSYRNNLIEWGHRIFIALRYYLLAVGYVNDAEQWIEYADSTANEVTGLLYGRVIHAIGFLKRWVLGDLQSAIPYLEKSLSVFRQLENPAQIALNLHHLSMCYYDQPEKFDKGLALAQEAISISEQAPMPQRLSSIGYTSLAIITYQRLRGQYREALETASRTQTYMEGNHFGLTAIHTEISLLYFLMGHHDDMRKHLARALSLAIELKQDQLLLSCLYLTVGLLIIKEAVVGATKLLGFVNNRANTAVASIINSTNPEFELFTDQLREQLDEATFEAAWAEGRRMSLNEAVAYALDEAGHD